MKKPLEVFHAWRRKKSDRDNRTMSDNVIQDWTDTQVPLKLGDTLTVKYKVFRDGTRRVQEIREADGTLIRKQELPEGMTMGKISFEASVRHALGNLVNA